MCLPRPHAYASYPSLIRTFRACALRRLRVLSIINTLLTCFTRLRALTLINRHFTYLCLVLCCVAITERWGMFCVFTPVNHSPLLSFVLPYKTVCMFFYFFLFEAIGYTIIYTIILQQHIVKVKGRGRGSNENHTTLL